MVPILVLLLLQYFANARGDATYVTDDALVGPLGVLQSGRRPLPGANILFTHANLTPSPVLLIRTRDQLTLEGTPSEQSLYERIAIEESLAENGIRVTQSFVSYEGLVDTEIAKQVAEDLIDRDTTGRFIGLSTVENFATAYKIMKMTANGESQKSRLQEIYFIQHLDLKAISDAEMEAALKKKKKKKKKKYSSL
eukprot:Platyproteum_vivax@DN8556_c0_g1_i1.p1